MELVKNALRAILLGLLLFPAAAWANPGQTRLFLEPVTPQYPPYDKTFTSTQNSWSQYLGMMPYTVAAPADWPYLVSWPYIKSWAYPATWPYSGRWDYFDMHPYREWWTYSDLLAYQQRWRYGDTSPESDRWMFPQYWPHPVRWSITDQWPANDGRPPSTADIGSIDMINDRKQAVAFGDYTFALSEGDLVYITRAHRMLGTARVSSITPSYAVLQAVRISRDYFLQVGDTFQLMRLPPAVQEAAAPRVSLILDDGRFVSYNEFVPRDYWRGDFFTVRRSGQNVGTARLTQAGYGYAIFQPAEDTRPEPGDYIVHRQAPQELLSIMKPRQLTPGVSAGIFGTGEPVSIEVIEFKKTEEERGKLEKLPKPRQWPDSDIWWEDTSGETLD
jgi:hypothetical protein